MVFGTGRETECGEADGNAGNGFVDEEKIVGEGITEEEEGSLEHEGQTFHDEIKVPGDHSVHFALAMPTAINNGPTYLHLGVTGEPLVAQHGDKRGEEGSGQTCVEDGLDVDHHGIGATPLGKIGARARWNFPELDTCNNLEGSVAHLLEIRFEVVLNIEDESGCDGGKQTGLSHRRNESTA